MTLDNILYSFDSLSCRRPMSSIFSMGLSLSLSRSLTLELTPTLCNAALKPEFAHWEGSSTLEFVWFLPLPYVCKSHSRIRPNDCK